MRYGLSIGVMGKMIQAENSTGSTPGFYSVERIEEFTGGISLGLNSALGINYALNDKLMLFAEINAFVQSWAPKRSEITTYTDSGVNLLASMTTYQKETEYEKEYTYYYGPQNPAKPNTESRFHLPMSSVGLQVGVTYTIGK
jgi:hypothetical protein